MRVSVCHSRKPRKRERERWVVYKQKWKWLEFVLPTRKVIITTVFTVPAGALFTVKYTQSRLISTLVGETLNSGQQSTPIKSWNTNCRNSKVNRITCKSAKQIQSLSAFVLCCFKSFYLQMNWHRLHTPKNADTALSVWRAVKESEGKCGSYNLNVFSLNSFDTSYEPACLSLISYHHHQNHYLIRVI